MDNQKIQEHVQTVREALLVASPFPWKWEDGNAECKDLGRFDDANGWTICDFGNHAQYYPTSGKEPDETDYTLIANSPTWLQQSIEIIEQQKNKIDELESYVSLFDQRGEVIEIQLEKLEQQQEEIEQLKSKVESLEKGWDMNG